LSGWPSASKDSKENRLECSFDGDELGIDRCCSEVEFTG
jgi:hypothetical protein